MGIGVEWEAFFSHPGEERIMHDLHKPDQTDHEQRRREVGQQQVLQLNPWLLFPEQGARGGEAGEGGALDLGLGEGVPAEDQGGGVLREKEGLGV